LDFEALSSQWAHRADSIGHPGAEVVDTLGRRSARAPAAFLDEHRFGATMSHSTDGAARRRDLVVAFSVSAPDGAEATDIERLTQLWSPPVSGRLEVGVAEVRRTLRSVVPGTHQLTALGPRPVDPVTHEVWCDASRSIDAYRQRWGVDAKGVDVYGVDALSSGISTLQTERLVDHLRVARQVEVACQRLGWRPARANELERGR
jgi:hypothetical protein